MPIKYACPDTDFTVKGFSKKSMTLVFLIFKLQIASKNRSANTEGAPFWFVILLSFLRATLNPEDQWSCKRSPDILA